MKNIISVFMLFTLFACGGSDDGGSGGGSGSDSIGASEGFLEGKWLGASCTNSGGNYYRIYFEMSGGTQVGAFLNYGADNTCSGAYVKSGTPPTFTPIVDFMDFSSGNTALTVSGVAANYFPFSYIQSGGGTRYSIIYRASDSQVYVPGAPAATNPGSNWSNWQSNPSLGAFTSNPAVGSVIYNKVAGLP